LVQYVQISVDGSPQMLQAKVGGATGCGVCGVCTVCEANGEKGGFGEVGFI
jgi:hypothetical protein